MLEGESETSANSSHSNNGFFHFGKSYYCLKAGKPCLDGRLIKLSDEKHSHTRRDDDNLEPETMLNLQMTLKSLLRMGLHVVCLQKNGFKDKKNDF